MTDSTSTRGPDIAHDWWKRLTANEGARPGQRRAALARMRRASTPLEVMQISDALRLIERLPYQSEYRVAALAGVLAFVRETDERSVARRIGRDSLDDDQSALVSENRFRRLLQVQDSGLMEGMRRLVRMNKGKLNVRDLAAAILYWGDGVKKRWIFDYYGVHMGVRSVEGSPETPNTTPNER